MAKKVRDRSLDHLSVNVNNVIGGKILSFSCNQIDFLLCNVHTQTRTLANNADVFSVSLCILLHPSCSLRLYLVDFTLIIACNLLLIC